MKRESGITIVTLAITIIVLGILIGVGITALTGDNGIIISTKQSKENLEATQRDEEEKVNLLYEQLDEYDAQFHPDVGSSIEKMENELLEFKRAIANYIEEAGGVKPETTEDKAIFRKSILGIVAEVTKDTTATALDIKEGKTAYSNGSILTGSMSVSNDILEYASDIQILNVQTGTQDKSFTVVEGATYLLITEARYSRTVSVYSGANVTHDISSSITKIENNSKAYIFTTTSSTLVLRVAESDYYAGIAVLVRLS